MGKHEKHDKNMNLTKIILSIVTVLVVNVCTGVVTYFSTLSSMKTDIELTKQKRDSDWDFIEFRLAKLESASPEKVDDGLKDMRAELDTMANNFKTIVKLLQ